MLPLNENDEVLKIVNEIEKAQREAVGRNRIFFFSLDISSNNYRVIEERSESDELNLEDNSLEENFDTPLIFISAKNSRKESDYGEIDFKLLPDGTKEFGLIVLFDKGSNRYYTLFLNPYFSSTEIIEGAIDFDELYSF